jgi:hypothetical protein
MPGAMTSTIPDQASAFGTRPRRRRPLIVANSSAV